MTHDDVVDLVISHDKNIDLMAQSINNLATAVGATSSKLNDLLDVISTQNILLERFNNMDSNIRDSFNRVHEKISNIENKQNTEGCPTLKAVIGHSDDLTKRVDKVESNTSWITRTIVGAFLTGVIGLVWSIK